MSNLKKTGPIGQRTIGIYINLSLKHRFEMNKKIR
jgi:hypothetical protein